MTDTAPTPEPIRMLIELRIRPDKLDDQTREWCENETVAEGFPISPENTAWFYAQMIADEASSTVYGCTAEVVA